MNEKLKEMSLIDALSFCSLKALPEKDDKKNVWIRALAEVKKIDGSESYVLLKKNPTDLENRIVKDFGTISAISKIIKVYPYDFLKSMYMPRFKKDDKNEKIAYLAKENKQNEEVYKKMSDKAISKEIIKIAIKTQLYHESNN